MLYQPDAHVPLVENRWDPARVRAAIREIVEDTEAAFEGGWPNHPRDEEGERRLRTVYLGAACTGLRRRRRTPTVLPSSSRRTRGTSAGS